MKKTLVVFACALACALIPAEARADAVNFGFVAVAGVIVLVPLTLFTMFVEGIPLAIGLRIPYRRTLKILLVANVVSLLAGIPVKSVNVMLYSIYMPHPLAAYFRAYPLAAMLGSLHFFIVTVLVEFAVVAVWHKRQAIHVGWKKLMLIVFIMNMMTYAVIAPLHYSATRPDHDVKTFTDGASWAQHPLTELYYISTNGNLCAIMTDGTGQRTVIPGTVRDYQCLPDQGLFLYRNGDGTLCLFRESDGQTIECWQTSQRYLMNDVTVSPDGKTVAYLEECAIQKNKYRSDQEPMLFDTETRQRFPTAILLEDGGWHSAKLSWGASTDTLFMSERTYQRETQRHLTTVTSIMVSNNTVIAQEDAPQPCALLEAYGRFSSGGSWSGGENWGVSFSKSTNEYASIYSWPGLGSHISVEQGNDKWYIADNPGLLKLGNRGFEDVCLLGNGQEFIFTDSKAGIYLVNLAERKVGLITSGKGFITLTPRYRQDIWDTQE